MIVRLSHPAYQAELIIFLRNSGIGSVRRFGSGAVRVGGIEEADLRPILDTWRSLHADVQVELVPEES